MARTPDEEKEIRNFLAHRQYRPEYRFRMIPKSTGRMQHDLARNLLVGFLILIIVILLAVYFYDLTFCSDSNKCGENFINMKPVIDTLLNFGTPFIGIIIGFFFSEKFKGGDDE